MRDRELGELKWKRGEYLYAAVKIPYFAKSGDLLYSPPDLTKGLKPVMSKIRPKTKGELELEDKARQMLAQIAATGSDEDREMIAALAAMGRKKSAGPETSGDDAAAAVAFLADPFSDNDSDEVESRAQEEAEEEPTDPWDEDVLFKKGKFKVAFVCHSRAPGKISSAQREAWNAIVERGDAIWEEVMEGVVATYRIQRPVALKWMTAIYGDLPLERVLPDYTSAKDIKRLVRPYQVFVPEAADPELVVGIHFACAWSRDGVGVSVRNGRVIAVDRALEIYFGSRGTGIQHPVFGGLGRSSKGWFGKTRCDPFLDFARIADEQIEFWKNPASHKRLVADLGWDFPHGLFDLSVFTRNGAAPSKAQVKAYAEFRKNERKYCKVIFDAILDYYRKTFDKRRRTWAGDYVDVYVPEANRIEDLQCVTELHHIDVYPEDAEGKVCLGLYVTTKWATQTVGVGIYWQDGKLLELRECNDQDMAKAGISRSES